ncbi:MAG TPA: type II secretion system F family protein [Tepidisphaeraceae bacterium]|nr:type II secretion system F family protein [Tepidisphaeraceae bacterium]
MAAFQYIAIDGSGKQARGMVEAESRAGAMDRVLGLGLSPLELTEKAGNAARKKVYTGPKKMGGTKLSQAVVESFTRELANLLGAGLPLARALSLLKREASHPAAKFVWTSVHDDVVGGESLAEAMAKWPRVFSSVYVAMVRAGEAGGFLDVVLQQIADFRTREADLKGKVKAAMVYPAVLTVMAVGVLIFLLTFFIPRFSGIFKEFGGALPGLTKVIVAASQGIVKYGAIAVILIVAAVIAYRKAMATQGGRRNIELAFLRMPGVGKVIARFALVRFCRMLGTLVGAGVPLVASLKVAKEALGNQTLQDTVQHAITEVQRGAPLAKSLAASDRLFPASVVEMITVAEETGRLDKELMRLSVAFEADLDRELRMLVALAEPIMLFVMASIIGTVVVGMLLPVFNLQDLMH